MGSTVRLALAAALTAGCSGTTLVRANDATPRPTSTVTKVGSPALLITPTPTAKPSPVATRPSRRPVATKPAPTSSPKPAPTGRVLIDSFRRRPPAEQTHFGCDRVLVTLVNRSTAAITSISVGFVTYYYTDKEIGSGDTNDGRNVTVTRQLALAAGAKKEVEFIVCLPEKKTRNVFGEPVSTSWVWARS